MSVLYFTNTVVRGGAEEHILALLRCLDRGSFRPYLACAPELMEKLGRDIPHDVETFTLSFACPFQLGAAHRLAEILNSRRIDILHSHMFQSSLAASPVGRLCGVPVVIETSHGRECWRKGWFKSRFWADRLAGITVDAYIAVSEGNARYLLENKRLPARKVVTIHNGCDLARFTPDRSASGLRMRLGLDEDQRILLVASRLEPEKGHSVLISALPAVLSRFPRTQTIFVGEGSLRPRLEEQIRLLGLTTCVTLVGHQSNMPEWFALADVVVLPSFHEGMPLVAIETLASQRPLVATAVDGIMDIVVDGMSGLIVPIGDSGRLAEAICRVLGDPDFARHIELGGRRRVERCFRLGRQIQETENLYRRCLWAKIAIGGRWLNRVGRVDVASGAGRETSQ